ncbi:MAG: peptidoglycan DD-metalloendopeptidase family protein [Immundisolibacteraceae bacterium]|nr:peptidoglycan DD-metalloendopeptidase family protein [Immundisolibacteraceae bacterium]
MAILLGFWPTSAWLMESDSDRLDHLRTDIETAQKNQSKNKQQQDNLRQQVVTLENHIDQLGQAVSKLHRQKQQQEQQISQLNIALAEQKNRLSEHQQLLAHLARRAYLNGQQEYLKLLINQQDPADIQRMLSYYRYLQLAHVSEIDELELVIAALLQTQQQLAELTHAANQTIDQISHQQDALSQRRSEHDRLLALLVDDYQDNQTRLNRMLKDEARLADLVTQLQQHIDEVPNTVIQRFASARNQLNWPVEGAIKHRFGQRKKGTSQRWNGMFFSTQGSAEVRAIHGGKVAFADWLRGFGLLIIVDHGEEYMSIYGQNQLVVPETGSWVEKGELIAHAGAAGGKNDTGLYFEIRHRGKPIDPAKWCH